MRYRTGFIVLFAIAGVQACGGASETDFSTPAGGKGAGGSGATGGSGAGHGGSGNAPSSGGTNSSGGSSGTSGSGGDAVGGTTAMGGTTATGGSNTTGGSSGTIGTGGDATGGTGGDAMGGTSGTTATGGTGGDAMGGTSGTTATGGTGGDAMGGGGTTATGGDGAGGFAGMTGGTAGSAGSGMTPDCAALEMDYTMTLQEAEACNPQSGKDQCTAMEKNSLTCPNCSVYVNPDNTDAIMHLADIRKQAGNHCVTPCPAIACVQPTASTCAPVSGSRSAGRCTSQSGLPL